MEKSDALFYADGNIAAGECPPGALENRAFLFGDGIYEVIRFYNGKPLGLDRHIRRLRRSAAEVDIDLGALLGRAIPSEVVEQALDASAPSADVEAVLGSFCTWLAKKSGFPDCYLYLQVTRGEGPRDHAIPPGMVPCLFSFVRPASPKAPGKLEEGLSCITVVDTRWLRCDIKSLNLLPNVIARSRAVNAGAYEAILYRVIDPSSGFVGAPRQGAKTVVTEASAGNVFIVSGGEILTHPADNLVLPGITRDIVIDICESIGLPVKEVKFGLEDLFAADEVFLTGTGVEVAPVTRVDGRAIGDGRPGRHALSLAREFANSVARL